MICLWTGQSGFSCSSSVLSFLLSNLWSIDKLELLYTDRIISSILYRTYNFFYICFIRYMEPYSSLTFNMVYLLFFSIPLDEFYTFLWRLFHSEEYRIQFLHFFYKKNPSGRSNVFERHTILILFFPHVIFYRLT